MARDYFAIEKGLHIQSENADTGVKILFGSGAPAIEAEIGSLYQRTDQAEVYKKIDTGTDPSDWEILPNQPNVANLITLSGVAANATTLGTFTGSTIPDSQTIKSALQYLETAVEAIDSEVVHVTASAVEDTPVMLDEVLVDSFSTCEWLVTLRLDSAPAQVVTMKVIGVHNGTASADATAVDDTVFGKLKIGNSFTYAISVALTGSSTTQKMQLMVAGGSGAAISAKATRIAVVF